MSVDLLPCPFCGGKAIPAVNDHARMWVIRCQSCNAEVWEKNDGHYHQDFIPIINGAWNRRTDLTLTTDGSKVRVWRDGAWLGEPPYVGTPLDLGHTVECHTFAQNGSDPAARFSVGGWPGYHTHFTQLPSFPPPPRS